MSKWFGALCHTYIKLEKNFGKVLILGVEEYNPSEYSLARKFFVMWVFLTIFTLLLYFMLCPLTYYLFYQRRDKDGKNVADWDNREGTQQISDEITLSVFSIIIMAGMTVGPRRYCSPRHRMP